MDFSKLTQEELSEYILATNNKLKDNLVHQSKKIFESGDKLVTIPVDDLYLATNFKKGPEFNLLTTYYTKNDVDNLSANQIHQLSSMFNIYPADKSRIYRILRILGFIIPKYTSEYNKLCNICNETDIFKKFCKLCQSLPNKDSLVHNDEIIKSLQYHYIDNMLNEKYLNADIQIDNIVIYPIMNGGFGDVIFAVKLYRGLIEKLNTSIIIISDEDTNAALSIFAPDISIFNAKEALPEEFSNSDFLMYTPYQAACKPGSPLYIDTKPKFTISISEYQDWKHENTMRELEKLTCHYCGSSGVFFDTLGIFIDHHIEKYKHIEGEAFKEFFISHVKDSHIFFGYAFDELNSFGFIYLVLLFYKFNLYPNPKNSITIFSRFRLSKYRIEKYDFFRLAKENGYNIRIYENYKDLNGNNYIYTQPGNIKTLTVINTSDIQYNDIQYIMKISDRFTLITGDQSVSDAISHNKVFVYEALSHKIKFKNAIDFIVDLLNLSDIYTLWNNLINGRSIMSVDPGDANLEFISNIYNLIYNTDDFAILNNYSKENFDIMPNIIGMLKRFKFYLNNPDNLIQDRELLINLTQKVSIDNDVVDLYFKFIENIFDKCSPN